MNDNDIEIIVYRILSGYTIFEYDNIEYLLKYPSIDIRYKASLLYNNIINDEKYQNWIREYNYEDIMIVSGIWAKNTNDVIKGLYKRLDDLKVELYKVWMMPSQQKRIRKDMDHIKKQLNKILSVKNDFFSHTLEGYASSLKNEYIICHTLYSNNRLVFDYNNKSNQKSFLKFNAIVQEIDKLQISLTDIKKIARSSLWRSYWSGNKHTSLFGIPVSDWTDDQRTIYKVAQMYDSVYDHPESPDEIVINDDDMLDGWMITQQRAQARIKKQNNVDLKNNKLKNSGEVYLLANNAEEIEEIQSMNDDNTRRETRENMDYLLKKGEASATELPSIKRELTNTLRELNKRR